MTAHHRLPTDTANDAGRLHRYIRERHARTLTHGGTPEAMTRAMRAARVLANLTGWKLERILAAVQADHLAHETA